jgi:hypothetical protein
MDAHIACAYPDAYTGFHKGGASQGRRAGALGDVFSAPAVIDRRGHP